MAAAGELGIVGPQLGGARRLLVDYLISEGCDLEACEVSVIHYKALARRLGWLKIEADWSIGDGRLALPLDRNEESRLWRVAWRPFGSEWLTSEELVKDMEEIHLGAGLVIVWPAAVKDELERDAKEHDARLRRRLSRPIKEMIVVECAGYGA